MTDYIYKFETPSPDALVSFSIVCTPSQSGLTLEDFRTKLTLDTVKEFLPAPETQAKVARQLRGFGFEVFDQYPSPVVSGRGPVKLFKDVFQTELVTRLRTTKGSESEKTFSCIVRHPDSVRIVPPADMPAMDVAVVPRPEFVDDELPPETGEFELHLPGDIAQLTRASATHRQPVRRGGRATGGDIAVAVIDTGFAPHPYYSDHGYQITKLATPDASDPETDEEPHGTSILAGLFACAPDVQAYAIKHGDNTVVAIAFALAQNPRVISLSFAIDLIGHHQLPYELIPLRFAILVTVFLGVTVVAAAGNGQIGFPGMLPEVISVGGVKVDEFDQLMKWPQSSSFISDIYRGRVVPDLCGIASKMNLPIPRDEESGLLWDPSDAGTSGATPQVAGVCALLLQKDASLSPHALKELLRRTAQLVDTGTGAGLVNALGAWSGIP